MNTEDCPVEDDDCPPDPMSDAAFYFILGITAVGGALHIAAMFFKWYG